jgi:hypothetical protein
MGLRAYITDNSGDTVPLTRKKPLVVAPNRGKFWQERFYST